MVKPRQHRAQGSNQNLPNTGRDVDRYTEVLWTQWGNKSSRNFPYDAFVFQPTKNLEQNGSQYQGVDKSLVRPGRKQVRKHVRNARDFDNMEKQAVIKLFFLQGKAQKEIHAIRTETLACFLPGRAKDLSAPLYVCHLFCRPCLYNHNATLFVWLNNSY